MSHSAQDHSFQAELYSNQPKKATPKLSKVQFNEGGQNATCD